MDPIADMLTIIKNGYLAKKTEVLVPYSKFKHELAKVLAGEKFVGDIAKKENKILISLIYENQRPKISEINRISKSGLRIYVKSKNIPQVKGGRGLVIVSTPKGLMTGKQAKDKKLGGEVICRLW